MVLPLLKTLQGLLVFTRGYSISQHAKKKIDEDTWSKDFIFSLRYEQFKKLCAGYFEEKCYRSKIVNKDNSQFDILLFKESYSSAKPFGIIKCWEANATKSEQDHLSQYINYIANKKIPLSIYITPGEISKDAMLIKDKNIKVIEGSKFLKLIQSLPEIRRQRLLYKIQAK